MIRIIAAVALVVGLASPAAAQPPNVAELDRQGWNAIRANQTVEAADAFRAALRLEPRNVRLLLGAGLAAHLLGRSEEARQHLVGALQLDATLTEASLLLGQILHRAGDVAGAIQVYEQALTQAPREALLTSRLETWRRELQLHDRFTFKYGDHFTVLFEGPREETLAHRAIEILEAAYWRIGTALGAYPAGIVTVVLYTNEQFRDVTQSPDWAAAAYDGRIRVPMRGALENGSELQRILSHEFTHALIHSIAPRGVPQWLNEGLAQLFEPGEGRGAAAIVEKYASSTPRGEPGASTLIPLPTLEKSFSALEKDDARLAYAQSAVATKALVEAAGMTGILNLLSFIGEGMPFPQAFERATFVSYAEFQKTWIERMR
jgi:tetratricopeptide (TPR) repeat protein